MSLLDDILTAAIDENVAVSALLMKCRLLAHRLGHEEFRQWVVCESEGYIGGVPVPNYRKVSADLKMDVKVVWELRRNCPVPVNAIPKDLVNLFQEVNLGHGMASFDGASTASGDSSILRVPRGEMAHIFQQMSYESTGIKINGEILDLWQEISPREIPRICDTVRGRVLDFTEEIRKKFPNAGEMSGDSPAAADRERFISQVFHTTVSKGGSVNVMGAVIDSTVINITAGDFGGLSKVLADNGFSQENINLLRDALDADKDGKPSDGFGPKVSEWLSKMMAKVANRSLDVSVDFLIKAITQYYGGA